MRIRDWSSDVCSSDLRIRLGSWLRALVLVPEHRLSGVRHLDPLLVGRCACDIAVVPVPPLVGRGLRIALGRVLPDLLPAQRRDVEVVPGAPNLLVAAVFASSEGRGEGKRCSGPFRYRGFRSLYKKNK